VGEKEEPPLHSIPSHFPPFHDRRPFSRHEPRHTNIIHSPARGVGAAQHGPGQGVPPHPRQSLRDRRQPGGADDRCVLGTDDDDVLSVSLVCLLIGDGLPSSAPAAAAAAAAVAVSDEWRLDLNTYTCKHHHRIGHATDRRQSCRRCGGRRPRYSSYSSSSSNNNNSSSNRSRRSRYGVCVR
jgi:hypothetical protein